MPTYNASKTIKESINSVLKQTYTRWELLITDDCSDDDTVDIVMAYSRNDSRIKLFKNTENSGAGFSRNNSIQNASGRFIAFLDSDDVWKHEKLEKQISFMVDNNYAFTYTFYRKMSEDGRKLSGIHPILKVDYNNLLKSNVIGCLTAIYDASILGKVYMPNLRKRQDMALWLSILKKIEYAYCLPQELAFYRECINSLSSNKFKALPYQWALYRKHLELPLIKSCYYFSHYAVKAIMKHHLRRKI